jgi:SnoaL-like domain
MDLDRNKAVVREFDALGNEGGDLSRLDQLCAPDVINHALVPRRPPGIEGTREFLRSAQRDVYPSRWVTSNLLAENDLVAQFGPREHHWPGGSFRGFELVSGRYTRDVMFGLAGVHYTAVAGTPDGAPIGALLASATGARPGQPSVWPTADYERTVAVTNA